MRYQVPQFIEVEDKVIGPLTVKQFIYIVGGVGLSFLAYNFLPIYISLLLVAGIMPLSLALAFYKINNKPFIDFMESAFMYYTKQNLYIWKKVDKKIEAKTEVAPVNPQMIVPKMSDSKLKDLSWAIDMKENLKGEANKDQK